MTQEQIIRLLPVFYVFISFLSLVLSFAFGLNKSKKQVKGNEEEFVMYFPKTLLAFGIILLAGGVVANYYIQTTLEGEDPQLILIMSGVLFVIFFFTFLFCVRKVNHNRIVVKGNDITVYPTFGSKFSLTFSDIVEAQKKSDYSANNVERIIIKTKQGKKFKVVSTMFSYNLFVSKL